jgi:tRNA pseudouridine38-40 synthase
MQENKSNTLLSYRYALTVEYDGSFFSGWQRQQHVDSVQETLERALFCLTQESAVIFGAGRTDAGVHATGQVAHFDLMRSWSFDKLRQGLNFYLRDKGVVVSRVRSVDPQFHARFSAKSRSYVYTIFNRSSPPLFSEKTSWWIAPLLHLENMHRTCSLLCGHHDFSRFRHRDCQGASPMKTVQDFHLKEAQPVLEIHVRSPSFLHRQVRMMVGALVQVGKGRWTPEDVRALLEDPLGSSKPPAAPAQGLCLVDVAYDGPFLDWFL